MSALARRLRERGVKRLRVRVSDARAPREDGREDDIDSDDDAGAHDGPYVLRCGATGAAGLPEDVTFDAWRPRRGMDAEELHEKYADVVDAKRGDEPFRENNVFVRGRGDGVDYVGKNFKHYCSGVGQAYEREHGEDMKTMLGRLRKSKSDGEEYELELIPIAGGRLIDLEARLHKYNYTKHSKSELADVNDPAVRAEINAKQLEAFASDKRKRQVNRLNAARKLDEASIASPKMMEAHITTAAANLKGRAELIVEAGKARNIPPHEPDAVEPDTAYPIESMPCHALAHKFHWKDLLAAAEDGSVVESEGKYEPLTVELSKHLQGGSQAQRTKIAKLLMYGDALLKMLSRDRIKEAKARIGEDGETKIAPAHPFMFTSGENVDPLLQEALIESYLDRDFAGDIRQYVVSKHRKDLIRLQVLLIALRVNGWSLELLSVRTHLRIDAKEIMAYMRQLGCRSVKGGNNPTVKLDLEGKPLVDYLPEIRARAKRAKPRE